MQITQDQVRATATQEDADANNSRVIASKVSVRLSPAARMSLGALIAAAEQAEAELETRFAERNMQAAITKRHELLDLMLRVASARTHDADLAAKRVKLLARNWRAYRDSNRRSVQEAMLAAALHADCQAYGFSIAWLDSPPRSLH